MYLNFVFVSGNAKYSFQVYKLAGPFGYFRGMQARILYQMPAAAICWSTYEFFKFVLLGDKNENNANGEIKEPSFTDALNLRLVLPETNMAEDKSSENASMPTRNDTSLKARELPAISGAHIYGALSLNTMHTENNTINNTTSRLRNDSTLFDIRTS